MTSQLVIFRASPPPPHPPTLNLIFFPRKSTYKKILALGPVILANYKSLSQSLVIQAEYGSGNGATIRPDILA